jgi:hypothetical protein
LSAMGPPIIPGPMKPILIVISASLYTLHNYINLNTT